MGTDLHTLLEPLVRALKPLHAWITGQRKDQSPGTRVAVPVVQVDPSSGEPIYQQLLRQIKHAIVTGALGAGERVSSVRELAAVLVINPNTVARAYRELEREGLLESAPGRGTFVRLDPPRIGKPERRARLKPFADRLVAEALALGFSVAELKGELDRAVTESSRRLDEVA